MDPKLVAAAFGMNLEGVMHYPADYIDPGRETVLPPARKLAGHSTTQPWRMPLVSYELEWVELPEPAAAARARYEACLVPCEHVPSCQEPYFSLAEPFQFHLNIAGMAFCRAGMGRAAMTYQSEP